MVVVASGPALEWLRDPAYPVVRRLALQLEGRALVDADVRAIERDLADDPWVAPLLAGELRHGVGGWTPVHPYKKWGGAHWRLVALAELGVTIRTPGAGAAIEEAFARTIAWLSGPGRLARTRPIDGRVRICGSQEGNALLAAARLGLAGDPRVRALAERLVAWQWPDGGWNCDVRPAVSHSSFNESWAPLGGLAAYRQATRGTLGVDDAIDRAAEFLLRHRIVESERTGKLADPSFDLLRWPPYWHYGLLPGLRALAGAGRVTDPRALPARRRLLAHRDVDGRWWPNGRWWRRPGAAGANVELVAWGREGEARMLTLHAIEVLSGP